MLWNLIYNDIIMTSQIRNLHGKDTLLRTHDNALYTSILANKTLKSKAMAVHNNDIMMVSVI